MGVGDCFSKAMVELYPHETPTADVTGKITPRPCASQFVANIRGGGPYELEVQRDIYTAERGEWYIIATPGRPQGAVNFSKSLL